MSGTVRGDAIAQTWVANAGAWIQAVRGERLESRRVATDAALCQLRIEVDTIRARPSLGHVQARCKVGSKLMAEAQLKFTLIDA